MEERERRYYSGEMLTCNKWRCGAVQIFTWQVGYFHVSKCKPLME
ncbi:hypothetical protein CCACVL1_20440 [Corchorus capsularis]|uniref:Uncharacterized protein n=1 Tax=Corchorus capsularis TaxID=210143 RepID=A0A1R3HB62_COCAP|nr:hypothetical protein CCACVL1_20440 [Corchorus capsularis]